MGGAREERGREAGEQSEKELLEMCKKVEILYYMGTTCNIILLLKEAGRCLRYDGFWQTLSAFEMI